MPMNATRDAKLNEILDRNDIWQVIQRYCRGMDRLDANLLHSCYFGDAIDDHGRFVGTAGDFIAWATRVVRKYPIQQHAISNHWCEIDGDDAHAETSYMCMNIAPDPPHLLAMGRYIDHFQRRNGEWRIANRIAIVERNIEVRDSAKWPTSAAAHHIARDASDVSYQRPAQPRRPSTI